MSLNYGALVWSSWGCFSGKLLILLKRFNGWAEKLPWGSTIHLPEFWNPQFSQGCC